MRTLPLLLVVCSGVLASQAPEFAQQYRQRLAGALAELSAVRADFLRDAERSGLTGAQAITFMGRSPIAFVRDRGASMERTLARHDRLARQAREIEAAIAVTRPLAVLSAPDDAVLRGAWSAYVPAVPVDPAGLLWTVFGGMFGFAVSRLLRRSKPKRSRTRARPKPIGRVVLSEG